MEAARTTPNLRLIRGDNAPARERLDSTDALARALAEVGAGVLTTRISTTRAEYIRELIDELMVWFAKPASESGTLRIEVKLAELESLMGDVRKMRRSPRTG